MIVSEIARLAGVPSHIVRYYTRIGLLRPGRNADNGYKTFVPADLERLRFIRLARRLGFSLTGISAILSGIDEGRPVAAETIPAMLRRRLAENLEQMRLLARQRALMEHALSRWRDAPPHSADLADLCGWLEDLLGGETSEPTDPMRYQDKD